MFLDKLRSFFRKNDGKEKLKIEYASPRNEYYGMVSERYSTLQMVLLVVLTLFILVALMINSSWISYENFYFFFNDFGNYLTTSDSNIENIIYDTGDFYDFEVFCGKLAVAGDSGISLYTRSGRTAFSYDESVASPQLESSERYMVLYDSGGKEYKIYNLFTEVYSEKTEYPVYGAAVADNGSYAIITGDGSHITCLNVYNRKFELIQRIGRASYIVDTSISPSGDRVAVLSYTQSGGKFITDLYLTKTSKTTPYADIKLDGCFPFYCSFTEKGDINVVCNDRIVSYNTNGKQISEYIYPDGYKISGVEANRYGCAAFLSGDRKNIVIMFDRNGEMVYNDTLSDSIEDISLYGDYVYLLEPHDIVRINSRTQDKKSLPRNTTGDVKMLAEDEHRVLLCMKSRTEYIEF